MAPPEKLVNATLYFLYNSDEIQLSLLAESGTGKSVITKLPKNINDMTTELKATKQSRSDLLKLWVPFC